MPTPKPLTHEQVDSHARLQEEFGLTDMQARYVIHLAVGGGNKAQASKDAGYSVGEDKAELSEYTVDSRHSANGCRQDGKSQVAQAFRSFLHELAPKRAESFDLTQEKVVEDLEVVKTLAISSAITHPDKAGAPLNAATRALELQGKALGMFITSHHKHEHELQAISTEALLERLGGAAPDLLASMKTHFGDIFEGEFEDIGAECHAELPESA